MLVRLSQSLVRLFLANVKFSAQSLIRLYECSDELKAAFRRHFAAQHLRKLILVQIARGHFYAAQKLLRAALRLLPAFRHVFRGAVHALLEALIEPGFEDLAENLLP